MISLSWLTCGFSRVKFDTSAPDPGRGRGRGLDAALRTGRALMRFQ